MKYKDFVRWCNQRACDGCWDYATYATYLICIAIMKEVESVPLDKRDKLWRSVRADVEEKAVKPIEEYLKKLRDIEEYLKKLRGEDI